VVVTVGVPAKCPLDRKSNCKGKQCHLYHVDWRTKEANCIIGYGSSHKTTHSDRVILDTYIENTRIKLGRDICGPEMPEKQPERDLQNTRPDVQTDKHFEKVTVSNKNTTVIESQKSLKDAETNTIHETHDKIKKDRAYKK
jgi:hypothetical protein